MMHDEAEKIKLHLWNTPYGIFPEGDSLKDVIHEHSIRSSSSIIYVYKLLSTLSKKSICVKRFTKKPVRGIPSLFFFQKKVYETLKDTPVRTPEYFGCNDELSLIIMEYIQGQTLEKILFRSCWTRNQRAEFCCELIRKIADGLSYFHNNFHSDLDYSKNGRENLGYVTSFQRNCKVPLVESTVPGGAIRLNEFIDGMPRVFWERHEQYPIFADCQPKNIVISDSGEVFFIDIANGVGHPLLDVSHFFIHLSRLKQWCIGKRADRLLRLYQRVFLDRYFDKGYSYPSQELDFFNLRCLVEGLIEQHRRHPWFWPYLKWFYRKEIKEIMVGSL